MTQPAHRHAPDPERMRRALRLNNRVFSEVDREVGAWLDVDRDARVLDAGCGVGGMATVLAGLSAALVAIDLDAENVRETGERLRDAGFAASADAHVADITALEDPEASFDLAWCSRVVHHLPDMLAGVRELARVTKPGGTVAIREGGFGFRVLPDEIGVGGRWFEDRLAAAGVARFAPPRNAADCEDERYPFEVVPPSSPMSRFSRTSRERLRSTPSARSQTTSRRGSSFTGDAGSHTMSPGQPWMTMTPR